MQDNLELRARNIIKDLDSASGLVSRLEAIYEQNSYAREITRHLTVNDKAYGRERLERRKRLQKDLMPERMTKLFPENFADEKFLLEGLEIKHFSVGGKKRDYLAVDLSASVLKALTINLCLMIPVPRLSQESISLVTELAKNDRLSKSERFESLVKLLWNDDKDRKVPLVLYMEERGVDSRNLLMELCDSKNSRGSAFLSQAANTIGTNPFTKLDGKTSARREDVSKQVLSEDDKTELLEFFTQAMEAGYTFMIPERLSSARRADMQGKTPSEMNQRLNSFGLNLIGLEIREILTLLEQVEKFIPCLSSPFIVGHRESALIASYIAAIEPRISACYNSEGFYDFCAAIKSSEILVNMSVPKLLRDFSMQDILALIAPRPLFLNNIKKALERDDAKDLYYRDETEYREKIDNLREVYASYDALDNLETELD